MKEDIVSFVRDDGLPFCVLMCGISYCDGTYEIKRKNSDLNVIEYIISGSGTVCENKKSLCASAGDVYFLKRGENHTYFSDKENPWVKIWMNFSGDLADRIVECYGLKNEILFHTPSLKKYFFDIYKISRSNIGSRKASEKCAVIFLKIAQELSEYLHLEGQKSKSLADEVKNRIDGMTSFSLSLDSLAEELSYSKNHIIRAFKTEYGTTPYEYMQNRRFAVAKSLLKYSVYSISEIAEKLSFCDARYFSGCFSRHFGISPSGYRRASKN